MTTQEYNTNDFDNDDFAPVSNHIIDIGDDDDYGMDHADYSDMAFSNDCDDNW